MSKRTRVCDKEISTEDFFEENKTVWNKIVWGFGVMGFLDVHDAIAFRSSCRYAMTFLMADATSRQMLPFPFDWLIKNCDLTRLQSLYVYVTMCDLPRFLSILENMSQLKALDLRVKEDYHHKDALVLSSKTLKTLKITCFRARIVSKTKLEDRLFGAMNAPRLEVLDIVSYKSANPSLWVLLESRLARGFLPRLRMVRCTAQDCAVKKLCIGMATFIRNAGHQVSVEIHMEKTAPVIINNRVLPPKLAYYGVEWITAFVWAMHGFDPEKNLNGLLFVDGPLSRIRLEVDIKASSRVDVCIEMGTVSDLDEHQLIVTPIKTVMESCATSGQMQMRIKEYLVRDISNDTWEQLRTLGIPRLIRK